MLKVKEHFDSGNVNEMLASKTTTANVQTPTQQILTSSSRTVSETKSQSHSKPQSVTRENQNKTLSISENSQIEQNVSRINDQKRDSVENIQAEANEPNGPKEEKIGNFR